MKYKYFVCDMDAGETDYFEKKEDALKWIQQSIDIHHDEGIGEDAMEGGIWWAEIKQKSKFVETDKKSNYEDPDEEWPYDHDFDTVGILSMEDIK